MSAIIYETINHYNRENNILPYRYIGSDQHNNSNYLGSSKSLLNDIKKIGKSHFEKRIICEFPNGIANTLLRRIESQIQRFIDVAKDPEYYNKTNSSHKGYIETEEEKAARMAKTHLGFRKWWDSLDEVAKENHRKKTRNQNNFYNSSIAGKTYEEIYGPEKAETNREKLRGRNNGMSKQVIDIKSGAVFDTMKEAMEYYGIKKYSTLKGRCLREKGMKFI